MQLAGLAEITQGEIQTCQAEKRTQGCGVTVGKNKIENERVKRLGKEEQTWCEARGHPQIELTSNLECQQRGTHSQRKPKQIQHREMNAETSQNSSFPCKMAAGKKDSAPQSTWKSPQCPHVYQAIPPATRTIIKRGRA